MRGVKIDRIDRRILRDLQDSGRMTNVELARRVHLSPSPCLSRVRRLEDSGLINRYVTLLDGTALGLGVSVFIQVRLERQVEAALETFEKAIAERPEVMECYLMTGDSDYLIRVVVPDVRALEGFIVDFLSRVPGVGNIKSSFSLKQVKYKTALPLPASVPPPRRSGNGECIRSTRSISNRSRGRRSGSIRTAVSDRQRSCNTSR